MTAFVNYPLTASDDDEFFDAPAGSVLLKDGDVFAMRDTSEWGWQKADGSVVQTGALWASLFADGNPFGDHDITAGYVLRVDLAFAKWFGMVAA